MNEIQLDTLQYSADAGQVCYMYITQLSSAWTCIAFLIIGLSLLVISVRQYIITKDQGKINFYINLTYIFIFITLILYILKLIFAETIFWLQEQGDENQKYAEKYSLASKFLFFLDQAGLFAMETCLILVPTNWINNVVQIFESYSNENSRYSQKQQIKDSIKMEVICFKILKYYLIVRAVLFSIIIIIFLCITNSSVLSILIELMLIWGTIEAFFVICVLVLCVLTMKFNKKLNQVLEMTDFAKVQRNYYFLIACATIRFLDELVYTIFVFIHTINNNRCVIGTSQPTNGLQLADVFLDGLLTRYLSVLVILVVYYVQKEQNEKRKPSEISIPLCINT